MEYKIALEVLVSLLNRTPMNVAEQAGANAALAVLKEAITPKVVDGPVAAEEPIQTR